MRKVGDETNETAIRVARSRSILSDGIGSPSLEKDTTEVGAMNLVMTHGAGLVLRRLVVRRPDWPAGRQSGRESMAPQTEHVHRHHFEKPRIGGTRSEERRVGKECR